MYTHTLCTVSTMSARVLREYKAEVGASELRPQLLHEQELGVCELPGQEVAQPALARGSDEEVGVWVDRLVRGKVSYM